MKKTQENIVKLLELSKFFSKLIEDEEEADLDAPNPDLTDEDFNDNPNTIDDSSQFINTPVEFFRIPRDDNDPTFNIEDERELNALSDTGEFADVDPRIDTDEEYYDKDGIFHPKVDYDRRKRSYNNFDFYKGQDNTPYGDWLRRQRSGVSNATDKADDTYGYGLDVNYPDLDVTDHVESERRHAQAINRAAKNPGTPRPELVDYDPDDDPNVKWYD